MSVPAETISFEAGNTRGWPKTKMQLEMALLVVQQGCRPYDAAIRAGYKKNTAKSESGNLVAKMRPFLAFLQEKKNEVAAAHYDVTTDRVLREMAAIGLQNVKDYIRIVNVGGKPRPIGKPVHELTDQQALAVQSWKQVHLESDDGPVIDYQYVLSGKADALVNLGRHLGMFSEKLMLDLNMRQSKAKQIDFSAMPQADLEQVIMMLESIQAKAAKARTIEGEFQRTG